MKKVILILLMLLPIYGFATNDTTETNVVYTPYPQYSFWSNWELGVNGGIITPFKSENKDGFNYMLGLSLYKEIDNLWTLHFNGNVNKLPNTVGYYGGLNLGVQLSLIDLFKGYDTTRFAKLYLTSAVGMGVDKTGYLVDNYGKFYYEAMAGVGVSWNINKFTIRIEDNIVLPADLGNGFTMYKSYYNRVHIGIAYNFGVTKVDKIRLEQMNDILSKGIEYNEVVDSYETNIAQKNNIINQCKDTISYLKIAKKQLADSCVKLEKDNSALDSLNTMIDNMIAEQYTYWGLPISIQFDFDSYQINSSEMEKIKQIGNVISDSTFKYMVVGFTDSIGSVEYNEKLAEKRAKSVYNKLVDLGVKPEQIEIKYVGKNSSFGDSGSYINRRVSVYRVIK